MNAKLIFGSSLVALSMVAGACVDEGVSEEDNLTSKSAAFYDLTFDGEVVGNAAESDAERKKSVVAQLFYLSGELDKTYGGHGRFGYVQLSNVEVEPLDNGMERVTYTAKVPIAVPKWRDLGETYKVLVPRYVDDARLDAFNTKYAGSCGKAKYGADTLWYDFQPLKTECEMEADDIVATDAAVTESEDITTNKRPEYEQFWKDGEFRMVVVHGTDGASTLDSSDVGAREYMQFMDDLAEAYPDATITKGETSHQVYDDFELRTPITAPDGTEATLVINALLAGSLKYINEGSAFDERYAPLSASADFIAYAGHSGLGKNIRAMANKSVVTPGQYQVFFIDGCSTFAYLDSSLTDRRIEANGVEDDPRGTKYLDLILNAQPVPWYSGNDSLRIILRTLTSSDFTSYNDLLDDLSQAGVPLIAGEEDNPDAGI